MLTKFQCSKAFLKALFEKITEKANKAGQSLKDYLDDEKNIRHLSLVFYDIMPLSLKIGMRHEMFYERFVVVFKGLRNQIFTYETSTDKKNVNKTDVNKNPNEVKNKTTKTVAKRAVKKAVKTPRKTSKKVEN